MTNYHYGVCNLKSVFNASLEFEIPLIIKNSKFYGTLNIFSICPIFRKLEIKNDNIFSFTKIFQEIDIPFESVDLRQLWHKTFSNHIFKIYLLRTQTKLKLFIYLKLANIEGRFAYTKKFKK